MRINSKKERQKFLELNVADMGTYALATYDNHTEPVWITKYKNWNEDGDWFLEAPCQLMRFKFEDTSDEEIRGYVESLYGDENVEKSMEYVRSMIRGGYLYEIESFQTAPFLPEKIDDLTLISEQYCLEWMLDKESNK